jgi:Ca-activated chloride channel family protein
MNCTRRKLVATLLLSRSRAHSQGDVPVFRSDVRLVEVPVAVLDASGRYVHGLKRDDFQIYDEGEPREVELFETEESPLSVAVLIDVSSSMEAVLPSVKREILALLQRLRPGDQAALFSFADRTVPVSGFTADQEALASAIRRLRPGGLTALFEALARVGQILASRPGKKALIVFTDGDDNSSALMLEHAVQRFRRESIPLYALAQGSALKSRRLMDTLEEMARLTGGMLLRVDRPEKAQELFYVVSGRLASSYLLGFRARPGNGEWRRLHVLVRGRRRLQVRCREGYTAL